MSYNIRVAVLVLGYFKLVLLNLPNMGFQINYLYNMVTQLIRYGHPWLVLVTPLVTTSFVLIEIIFCILLLVGCHKKSRSILRAYFWYGIVGAILNFLLYGYVTAENVAMFIKHPRFRDMMLRNPHIYATILWFGLVNIAIQISLLVLVRQEMRKLQNNTKTTKPSKGHTKETELQNIS